MCLMRCVSVVRAGCQRRYLPNDLPPRNVVYQQARRRIRARCCETRVEDLRMLLPKSEAKGNSPR